MPVKMKADEFLDRLETLRSSQVTESHKHLAPDTGDVILGVRMGQVFALAKEFIDMPLDEVEKEYIRKILEKTGGNKYQAAHALGIDRKTLYRKLAEIEGKAQPGE